MPTNKKGEYRTWKEFFREWKTGMEKVTPLQQSTIQLWGIVISLIGIVWGIIFSIRLSYWWMMVILIGALIVVSVQFLGVYQRKTLLKQMEDAYNNAEKEEIKNG